MAGTDSSSDEDADYYNDSLVYEENQINVWLIRDISLLKQLYGNSVVKSKEYPYIDLINIQLFIDPTVILQKEICDAWGICSTEKIMFEFDFSMAKYILGSCPSVVVSQPSIHDAFHRGKQLQNIVQAAVVKQWKELPKHYKPTNFACHDKDSSNGLFSCVQSETVNALVGMGFSLEKSTKASYMCSGNLQEAIELVLTDSQESLVDDFESPDTNVDSEIKSEPLEDTSSDSESIGDKDKLLGGFKEDLHLMPVSSGRPSRIKVLPNLKDGLFVQLYQYILQRLPTLNEFCVICDEPHVFQNGPMLKPSLCARELCYFAHHELGVMADAVIGIASGAEVVDLLIAIAVAVSSSSRRELIFDPFPSIVNPKNPREFILSPKKKDYNKVNKALNAIPSMKELTSLNSAELKTQLNKINPLSYSLMEWIIFSNRCHIVKLPTDMQLRFMHTPHQFLLLSSPPAKEQIFSEAKKKHGVKYAFHGSHIENWHSIMRMGLLNASGTKHQLHGAAFGKGIYLSPCSSVSFSYSNMGWGKHHVKNGTVQFQVTDERYLRSKNLNCIALCEVVDSDELVQSTPSVWVCSNPDLVCTRFFFVYEDGRVGDISVNTESAAFSKQICDAVSNYREMYKNFITDEST